jgi:hypothetical protein
VRMHRVTILTDIAQPHSAKLRLLPPWWLLPSPRNGSFGVSATSISCKSSSAM